MKARGFTIIELLVVIAIITLLAAIICPVYAQAKQKAHQVSCQSNLKNLATAFLMYVDDNGDKFPSDPMYSTAYGYDNWATKLFPYMGRCTTLFKCQSDIRQPSDMYADCPYGKYLCSYSYNAWLGGDMETMISDAYPSSEGIALSAVAQPDKVILIHDTPSPDVFYTTLAYPSTSPCFMAGWYTHSYRHSGGDNFAFADGHVNRLVISMDVDAPDAYTDPEHGISFDYRYDP